VIAAIESEGAPRDLGLDQGRACRAALREALESSGPTLRWLLPLGASEARLARDLKRHFPHLAESLAGLASGAGVPERWLVRQLANELASGSRGARAVASGLGGAGALLAVDCAGSWIARRSRPEGGFACVELARPWLVTAFAGVNEAGLAVVALPANGAAGACSAPAALLAQDCLQRFSKVESALDWCCGRPAGHGAALLFSDARGELAGVEIRAAARRVLRADAALLAWADDPNAGAELAKCLRQAARTTAAALAQALAPARPPDCATVIVDPVARRLGLCPASGAEPDWLAL
jgi:hypothetical protein